MGPLSLQRGWSRVIEVDGSCIYLGICEKSQDKTEIDNSGRRLNHWLDLLRRKVDFASSCILM